MRTLLITSLILILSAFQAQADVNVVTSIKPVHSIVSAVMKGNKPPYLIVKSSNSPHNYNMKPSDARALKSADIIFWISDELETFLQKPIRSLGKKAKKVELIKVDGLQLLDLRKGKNWDEHVFHDHDDKHDDIADMHIWLAPHNAKRIVEQVVRYLVEKDPLNAELYKKNAYETLQNIDLLDKELKSKLAPYAMIPFTVFHDSYQYFEKHYNLHATGSITFNPNVQVGAKHLLNLRKRITSSGVKCVFSEPQFDTKIVTNLSEAVKIRIAVLDPLGSNLKNGPDLYFQMMRDNANAISKCLKP